MSNYLTPGVYMEALKNSNNSIQGVSTSVGCLIGITERGPLNTPTLVTSKTNFKDKFAYGLKSAYLANSDLAYAVDGFFANGGSQLYVIRVASATAKKATNTLPENADATALKLEAQDVGAWGNSLKVAISANADNADNFDITIKLYDEVVDVIRNVPQKDANVAINSMDYVNLGNKFITYVSGDLAVTQDDLVFTGGSDGTDDITDQAFLDALPLTKGIKVNFVSVPGQTTEAMLTGILSYCNNTSIFPILDAPKNMNVEGVKKLRQKLNYKQGELHYPWVKVNDPLSDLNKVREVPACGHVMGVYARMLSNQVWRAPAGLDSSLTGVVDVVTPLTKDDTDILNPIGVNCLIPKTGYGIVIWGARSLCSDDTFKYVSDILLKNYIEDSIYEGTQFAVFKPNDERLWTQLATMCQAFLDDLWRAGGLVGTTSEEAYFVKCDEELNPRDSSSNSSVVVEVAYANAKPAEFVIIRVDHNYTPIIK